MELLMFWYDIGMHTFIFQTNQLFKSCRPFQLSWRYIYLWAILCWK